MLAKATPSSKAGRKLPSTRHLSQKAFHRGLSTSPRKTHGHAPEDQGEQDEHQGE